MATYEKGLKTRQTPILHEQQEASCELHAFIVSQNDYEGGENFVVDDTNQLSMHASDDVT